MIDARREMWASIAERRADDKRGLKLRGNAGKRQLWGDMLKRPEPAGRKVTWGEFMKTLGFGK